jgi:hypothetical protein
VTKAEKIKLDALLNENEHLKQSCIEQSDRANKAEMDVRRLSRERDDLQRKAERLIEVTHQHQVLHAEFRMVRSELQRMWSFVRKENGIAVPEETDFCPF